MKYRFYAITDFHGNKKVLFKCKGMTEYDCLTLSSFLPSRHGDNELSYYIVSEDYLCILELSFGRVVSILKFDEGIKI